VTLNKAEHAFLGDQCGPVRASDRLSFGGPNLIGALVFGPSRAQRTEDVRNAPDAILISHQDVVLLPREAVRFVKILHMTLDPIGAAATGGVAQQRQVTDALLCHKDVAIGQNEQAPRICEAGH
jgi:hypothetical protein